MGITLQYGPDASTLKGAVAPLRAAAEQNGLELRDVSKLDMVAASYAAEQWCRAHRTRTLEFPGVHGPEAVKTLAAVLTRASGRRVARGRVVPPMPRDDAWEALTETLTGDEAAEAARRMLGDLTYGGSPLLDDWLRLRLGLPSAEGGEPAAAW